ncbi:MAG TPA: DHA2 family efflux MFS transporter permease subunit [Conexibacter sp.]|jgi:EmrB/QacA subfamily drug resistance transporter
MQLDRATKVALFAMALGIFVVANDFTALSVALPKMQQDLDADLSTVQWVINAYALVFGVLTVSGGRLADLLGRRRVFVIGAVVFGVFSLLAAVAPSAITLIIARAVMAVGGALMWPSALALIFNLLPQERRGLAGGIVLGVAGLGNAAGPLIGGALTELASWRWVLAVNVPIALLAIAVVLRVVPESSGEEEDRRFDYAGMALVSGSLVALLVALDQTDAWGWGDSRVIALFSISVVLMAGFVWRERLAGAIALIPRDVAANRDFRIAAISVLLMSMTFFTALVYVPQYLEHELGFSALGAGAGILPMMLIFGVSSFAAGPLYERYGGRAVIVAGALCLPVGMALLSLAGVGSAYGVLIPGLAVLGVGVGLFYSSITTAAISALDERRSGLAGGILYMLQVAGGSVGLGLATTIVTGDSLVDGIQTALRVSAGLAAIGLAVVLTGVHPQRAVPVTAPSGA